MALPAPLPGLEGPAQVAELLRWARTLVSSPRVRESDAGVSHTAIKPLPITPANPCDETPNPAHVLAMPWPVFSRLTAYNGLYACSCVSLPP